MKRIFKYQLRVEDKQEIEIPAGAQILSVQNQSGIITMWALVSIDATLTKRTVYIVGTGNAIPDEITKPDATEFVGTVQQSIFVWHIFIKK